MNALDLLRSVAGSNETIDRPHHPNHASLEVEDLEPRQLLSAVQGTTNAETTQPLNIGATAGMAEAAGFAGQPGGSSTVVTHAVGDVNLLSTQLPINDILANAAQVTDDVYSSDTPIGAATGLTSLPITPLLAPTVTSNETPLNNGTPDIGTVWITPPPIPPGLLHFETTEIPLTSNTWMQTVNPQGGPPTFTHFGQGANASMNGAAVNQPVAVGPIGPSITEEVEPVQPPPVESHQPVGPPTQVQQDETTSQQDAQTPPGGEQGAGQPGTPGQGSAPGQTNSATQGHSRSAGGETTQGVEATTLQSPQGQNPQGAAASPARPGGGQGPAGGAVQGPAGSAQGTSGTQAPAGVPQGGTGSPAGGGANPSGPQEEASDTNGQAAAYEVIDEAIPSLVANSYHHVDDPEDSAGALPTVFGAAAVAAGGFHLALRGDRARRGLAGGPPDGSDATGSRRRTEPSRS